MKKDKGEEKKVTKEELDDFIEKLLSFNPDEAKKKRKKEPEEEKHEVGPDSE